MNAEEAFQEVAAKAEELIDWSHGGRQTRLETMPYKEYLATPEWDEKRRAAYRKADFRCQLCNASGSSSIRWLASRDWRFDWRNAR